jgi:hypothetical protein
MLAGIPPLRELALWRIYHEYIGDPADPKRAGTGTKVAFVRQKDSRVNAVDYVAVPL